MFTSLTGTGTNQAARILWGIEGITDEDTGVQATIPGTVTYGDFSIPGTEPVSGLEPVASLATGIGTIYLVAVVNETELAQITFWIRD